MNLKPDPKPTYLRGALIGGGIAGAVLLSIGMGVSIASGADARQLLQASLPTVRFLASSVVTASATTLALLLTLLSLSGGIDTELDPAFYRRLQRLARLDVVSFVVGIVLMVSLILPLGEETRFSGTFYTAAFYTLSAAASLSAGLLVSAVLALYGAVRDLIETCWLDTDRSPLTPGDD